MQTSNGARSGSKLILGSACMLLFLVGAVALMLAIHDRRVTWESVLRFLPPICGGRAISKAEAEVQDDLMRLQEFIAINYMGTAKRLPDSMLDLFAPVNRAEFLKQGYGFLKPRLIAGIDPWGHPYVYKVRPDAQGVPAAIVTIRSVGPNGRDENGGGDDIWKDIYAGNVFPQSQELRP